MTTSAIEKELRAATKIKMKPGNSTAHYLEELAKACDQMSSDAWEGLSKKAQRFSNVITEAYEQSEKIPNFPDLVEDDEEETTAASSDAADTEEEESDVVETTSAKTTKKTGKAKTAARPKARASAEKSETVKKAVKEVNGAATAPRKLTTGAPTLIKQMLLKEPGMSKDDICAALVKKGLKTSSLTVATVRSDFRHSMRVLQEAGKLPKSMEI